MVLQRSRTGPQLGPYNGFGKPISRTTDKSRRHCVASSQRRSRTEAVEDRLQYLWMGHVAERKTTCHIWLGLRCTPLVHRYRNRDLLHCARRRLGRRPASAGSDSIARWQAGPRQQPARSFETARQPGRNIMGTLRPGVRLLGSSGPGCWRMDTHRPNCAPSH